METWGFFFDAGGLLGRGLWLCRVSFYGEDDSFDSVGFLFVEFFDMCFKGLE